MSVDKYRINPDFVVPDPTPANAFGFLSLAEFTDQARDELFAFWGSEGVKQARLTIVNEEYPESGYPHGIWFEGWYDENARQIPFGAPWPNADSAIWPPLTSAPPASGTLTEGGDVEQAPSDSLSGPTGNAGDAQDPSQGPSA